MSDQYQRPPHLHPRLLTCLEGYYIHYVTEHANGTNGTVQVTFKPMQVTFKCVT
jgi:hypothetical protein